VRMNLRMVVLLTELQASRTHQRIQTALSAPAAGVSPAVLPL
jgi:hypothetical protein